MSTYLKHIIYSLIGSIILVTLSCLLDSKFLDLFLNQDLISLYLTLLAINIATITFLSNSIEGLRNRSSQLLKDRNLKAPVANFRDTYKEMNNIITEQIAILILSSIFLILKSSPLILEFYYFYEFVNIMLCSTVIYSGLILFDVAKSIYRFNEHIQEIEDLLG